MPEHGPVASDPQLFLGRSIVLTLRGGLRYLGTLASVDLVDGGTVVLDSAQEAVLQAGNGGLQLVPVGQLTVAGNDVADLVLVPQSGQFGPPPAAEQTPCTPQQTRLRAPSLPHSASRGQVTQPGHLSVAATGAVQATGAAAAHTPTRRASSTVPEPGLGQGQRSLGAPSSSNSSATPASAASDHTWGTHTPDSECPGSARHLSNAMRGLQLAPTPEAAEAHAHAAGACAASRHADMAHHRGAHASLGAELAAATPFRAAPATAAPRQSLQAGTSAGQQSAALASLAPATATPSATLGSSMHASAGSITPATSTTPVACDGVANPFSQHTTAGLGGTLGDAMSGWDLARMGGMAGAPSLLQHAADLAAAPQLLAAPQLQRQGAAPDVQALVAQLLGQLQQPAGIQPQQPQPHLAAGGLPPAVASLLASLTQQQQGPDVDQQLRLQLLMAAATRLLSAQQQQAAQLQPPQPTSQPLSSLGQISVPSASAAQMAGPSLLAAQQQLAALNPAPGPSSFPAAASLLMMAPTTQPSRTPSLLHSPLPPQGRIGRGALQAHGTPGHGNSHAAQGGGAVSVTPSRSPLTQSAARRTRGGTPSGSSNPPSSGINMPKPVRSPGPASAARLAATPVADHKGLQDLQHFLVERASLAASGLMSDEEWCAVTGEALRRLASLELKLELAMGTLVNWANCGIITPSQYEAMRTQLLLGLTGPPASLAPPTDPTTLMPLNPTSANTAIPSASIRGSMPMSSAGAGAGTPPPSLRSSSKTSSNAPTGRSTPARRISSSGNSSWADGERENVAPGGAGGALCPRKIPDVNVNVSFGGALEGGETVAPVAGWMTGGENGDGFAQGVINLGGVHGVQLGGGVLGVRSTNGMGDAVGSSGAYKKGGELQPQQLQRQVLGNSSTGSTALAACTPARRTPPPTTIWCTHSPGAGSHPMQHTDGQGSVLHADHGAFTPGQGEDSAHKSVFGGEWGSAGPSGLVPTPSQPHSYITPVSHKHQGHTTTSWRVTGEGQGEEGATDGTSRVLAFGDVGDQVHLPATLSSRATSVSSSPSVGNLAGLHNASCGSHAAAHRGTLHASTPMRHAHGGHPHGAATAAAHMQMTQCEYGRMGASPSASPAQHGHAHAHRSVTVSIVPPAPPAATAVTAVWPVSMGVPPAAAPTAPGTAPAPRAGSVTTVTAPGAVAVATAGAVTAGSPVTAAPVTYAALGLSPPIVRGMADCGFRAPDAVQAHLLSHLLPPVMGCGPLEATHGPTPGIKVLCVQVPSCPAAITALSAVALQAVLAATAVTATTASPATGGPSVSGAAAYRVGALVVCPRREEAEDLGDMVRAMAFHSAITAVTCVGGTQLVLPPPAPLTHAPAHSQPPHAQPSAGNFTPPPTASSLMAAVGGASAASAFPATSAGPNSSGGAGGSQPQGRDHGVCSAGVVGLAVAGVATDAAAAAALPQLCVAVGTPGRVLDLLRRGVMDVTHARCIAFMEAPSLLSRHFRPQINELAGYLAACVGGAQVVLLSPTDVPHVSLTALERALATAPPPPATAATAVLPTSGALMSPAPQHPRSTGGSGFGAGAGAWNMVAATRQAAAVMPSGGGVLQQQEEEGGVGGGDQADARGARDQDLWSTGSKAGSSQQPGALAQFAAQPTPATVTTLPENNNPATPGGHTAGAGSAINSNGNNISCTPVAVSSARRLRLNPFAPEFSSPQPAPLVARTPAGAAAAAVQAAPAAAAEPAAAVSGLVPPTVAGVVAQAAGSAHQLAAEPAKPDVEAPAAETGMRVTDAAAVPSSPLPAVGDAAACITLHAVSSRGMHKIEGEGDVTKAGSAESATVMEESAAVQEEVATS